MKQIKIILLVFVIAMATSLLYDLKFIAINPVRIGLVSLLIFVQIAVGFYLVKTESKK